MTQTDRDLYYEPDWTARRHQYARLRDWYNGKPLQQVMSRRDRVSGSKVRRFPLGLNLSGLGCDIHRDIARGRKDTSDPLVVRTVIDRSGLPEQAAAVEQLLNDGVWIPSHGGPVQQEALLDMNIYGGAALQITWEPWEDDLPYRLAVRLLKDPSCINPVPIPRNPWKLASCYIGYEISHEVARTVYNVTPKSDMELPLYMEHWTRDSWRVQIDDQVPEMEWNGRTWALEGENPWGLVPVYYIPHERTTDPFWGKGIIGDEDIVKEINSRAAGLADIVRSAWPGLLAGRDMERKPEIIPVVKDGTVLFSILNIGRTRGVTGANPPDLFPLPVPEIPSSVADQPSQLMSLWQKTRRLSPALFGEDSTQSGRITGPAVNARMVSTTNHAITERVNFSQGKTCIDRDLLKIVLERRDAGVYKELDIALPEIDNDIVRAVIRQRWPPMLPLDEVQEHLAWIDRLREHGTSIDAFLSAHQVDDVEGEKELILEWLTYMAEIEAKKKPVTITAPGDESGDQSSNQTR